VGRHLWHAPGAPQRWTPGPIAGQQEFFIGALAHTHYFDGHSPEVGKVLSALIY
jgi:hypothetical protein